MTTHDETHTHLWRKIWHWLSALDEAVHDDPTSILTRKVNRLESGLANVEADIDAGPGGNN